MIRIDLPKLATTGASIFFLANIASAECDAIDYMTLSLNSSIDDPERSAILHAYPASSFSPDGSRLRLHDGPWIAFGEVRDISPVERLRNADVIDHFHDVYPLSFDLDARAVPYYDPGRFRSDAFFRAIYGNDDATVRATLTQVTAEGLPSGFQVTEQQNVACQLEAILETLAAAPEDYTAIFSDVGGGFNWRTISGTSRLSAHSYGIAVDVNAAFGQYWKWTGAQEGNVRAYDNRIPPEIVETFERYGFIWGGKWHHFDGMHFEFRPELIIHSRLIAGDPDSSPEMEE